mgnify:CR=1 FL=1
MYEKRAINYIGTWQPQGWRLKVYGIAYGREHPAEKLISAAKDIAEVDALPRAQENYGVGFVGIHQGMDSNFVLWIGGLTVMNCITTFISRHQIKSKISYIKAKAAQWHAFGIYIL